MRSAQAVAAHTQHLHAPPISDDMWHKNYDSYTQVGYFSAIPIRHFQPLLEVRYLGTLSDSELCPIGSPQCTFDHK